MPDVLHHVDSSGCLCCCNQSSCSPPGYAYSDAIGVMHSVTMMMMIPLRLQVVFLHGQMMMELCSCKADRRAAVATWSCRWSCQLSQQKGTDEEAGVT